MDLMEKTRRYQDYIHALEEERRKIQVFQRELPLCLQLVSQSNFLIRSICALNLITDFFATLFDF